MIKVQAQGKTAQIDIFGAIGESFFEEGNTLPDNCPLEKEYPSKDNIWGKFKKK